MRFGALVLVGIAALIASIEAAPAQYGPRDCGPGMNSDGYRCVPIARRYYGPYGTGPQGPLNCGPGMNSDGYRCVPIARRYYGPYDGGGGYYRRGRGTGPQGPLNCGPGMNSDGYRCVPIARRWGY